MISSIQLLGALLTASAAFAQVPCFDPAAGTLLQLTNDSFSPPIGFGFGFDYDGVTYTTCQVCSNGYVVLGSGPTSFADPSPTANELQSRPQARICPLWRDLDPGAGGQVSWASTPASGNDPARFTVTWDAVPVRGTTAVNTFQVTLLEGGAIQLHHDANTANGTGLWLIGASPGNGAPSNWVSFASLPFDTGNLATLHDAALGGPTFGRHTMRWTPNGTGGFLVAAATGCATAEAYGHGCGMRYSSFYEHFPTAVDFDLSHQVLTGLFTGSGYLISAGLTSFVPPSAAAINLGLTDDSVATFPLPSPFPYPGGVTTSLTVCSNGFVSTGNLFPTFDPHVGTMLSWAHAAWTCWRDYEPTPTNNVLVETVAGTVYVTWDDVPSFSAPDTNTFQFQFELATGNFHLAWQNMDTVGGVNLHDDYLVGYTPGNGAADPGNYDLTTFFNHATTIVTALDDVLPLALEAQTPPLVATPVDLVTSNITPTALLGAVLLGLTRFEPGIDLGPLGMPGCRQFHDAFATLLFVPTGAPAVPTAVTMPNAPGLRILVQSAILDPAAGLTPLGAATSNGVELQIGL